MSYEGRLNKPKRVPRVVEIGKEIEHETPKEDTAPGPIPTAEAEGPLYYSCHTDPGDVGIQYPGEGIPFCRYCGFPMTRVGDHGREKRDRM